jgi:hypothetical protein
MSPADKRYLDVNRRRDKISRRYARELTEEIYKANLKYIKGADLSNLENVIYPVNYPSTDVEKLVEDLYFDAGYLFSDQFVKDFAQGKFKSDLSEGIPKVQWKTEAIGKYFRSNLNQIKTISLTSEIGAQRLLNSVVYDAIQDGKGIRAVTDALKNDKFLRNLKRTSRFQAERIARTETLSAASYGEYLGSQELFQKYGVTMGKYWIAKKDARTRNSHNEMKRSETIGAEEDFEVGGSKMQFPGDRRGGASQVINCRCALGWRRIEEETPAPPQANIPTPIIPEDVKPTIPIVTAAVKVAMQRISRFYKSKNIKVPEWNEDFKRLLSIPAKNVEELRKYMRNYGGIKIFPASQKRGTAYYDETRGEVTLGSEAIEDVMDSEWFAESLIYHEFGHAIHVRLDLSRPSMGQFNYDTKSKFNQLFERKKFKEGYCSRKNWDSPEKWPKHKSKFESVEAKYKEKSSEAYGHYINGEDLKAVEVLEEALGMKKGSLKGYSYPDVREMYGSYADTIQALSEAEIGFGHSVDYMQKDAVSFAEFFAHASENRFLGNPVFEHLDKSLYDDMIKAMDEILEENGI